MCVYRVYSFVDGESGPQDPSYRHHPLATESRDANFKTIVFHNRFSMWSGDRRPWPFGQVAALVDQDRALERHDHRAILLEAGGFDPYDPHVGS